MLQIDELLDNNVNELSGGQSQRVALARAVVRKPAAFLFDEPMSDLDANLKVEMRKELGKIQNQLGETMLYVTHDQEEAMTLSDRIAVINDGNLAQIGTPNEVFQNPKNTFVAKFIGSPNINFLDCTVDSITDDTITLLIDDAGSLRFKYESNKKVSVDSIPNKVILAFRPSRVSVDPEQANGITGTIELNESIGDEVIQYLDGPQGELRVVSPANQLVDEGERVGLEIPTSGIHLFDSDTQQHLLRGFQSDEPVEIREFDQRDVKNQ
jgi:ABC-type sugar transport system ATPase subunit